MNIVELQGINKSYDSHRALQNVSLQIPEKTIFGLLGPNGAGKTSLLRIITQILAPDSGELFLMNEKASAEHTALIGYLPEERGLYKKMEVGAQLLYFARLKGLSKSDAQKKLNFWTEKLEIGSWLSKNVEELSKGMQQKVQFIATIIHDPRLIILDEPFSGFDPINADTIRNEILELKKEGKTIIFSTHRMDTVEELCDSIVLINQGEKIMEGTVKNIKKASHGNLYVIEAEGNFIASNFFEIVSLEQKESNLFEAVLQLKDGYQSNDLLNDLIKKVKVISFREKLPTMHDIFVSKIKEQKV